jgi:hypothetical protein
VPVVPQDAQSRRLLPKDLLDDSVPWRPRRSLGLDHDAVSDLRGHHSSSQGSTTSVVATSGSLIAKEDASFGRYTFAGDSRIVPQDVRAVQITAISCSEDRTIRRRECLIAWLTASGKEA